MKLLAFTLSLVAVAGTGCGGDDDGNADIDAPDPVPDAGVDAETDAAVDAPLGAPVVTITSHTDGQRITGSRTIMLAGTLADPDSTISTVTVTVGAAAPITATFDQTSFSASIQLGDNDNAITVTATDDTATSGADQVTVVFPYVALTNFQSATMVLGQSTFITGAIRNADAGRIRAPYGKPTEIGGIIYVSDYDGERVLGFRGFPALDGAPADFVLGQTSFTSTLVGTSATLLDGPQSVLGYGGRMYLLEYDNSRILIWNTPPTTTNATADAAIGQINLTSNASTCTATGLNGPEHMFIVGTKLLVSDADNNRVLIWNTVPTAANVPADLVLGQADFTHCAADDDNQDGTADATPTARTLDYPTGLWSDGTRLFVADDDNRRVLVWNTFPTISFQAPDFILGQPDAISQTTGTAADRFSAPYDIASNGNQLFVADRGNNRVKVWNTIPTTNAPADVVLGQGDFTHVAVNDDNQDGTADATPTARTLRGPSAVWFLRDRLFVSDNINNRILLFGTPICALNTGLYEFPYGSGTCVDDPCNPTSVCTNYRTCSRDTGVAVCSCPAGITGDCDTCLRYVDPTATGASTGFTWTDAMTSIPSALSSASSTGMVCEVWAKEGTYHAYASSDANSFSIGGNVTLYGGFAGDETTIADRHGTDTILDGRDAAGSNDVRHVVSAVGVGTISPPAIDRVTIQYGNADGTGSDGTGGGVFVPSTARLAITDCVIQYNRAALNGGGISSAASGASGITITDSVISENYGGTGGGGASLSGGTITNSTIEDNTAGTTVGHGGGGLSLFGTGTMTATTVRRNWAGGDAGGVWVRNASNAWAISNSRFESNEGTNGGGLYFDASGGGASLRTSVVTGNVARGTGGGIFVRDSAPPIVNVTVAGNVSVTGYGGVSNSGSSGAYENLIVWGNAGTGAPELNPNGQTITYSDIAGGHTGTGNIDAAPLYANAPLRLDRVVTQDAADTITVTTGTRFAVGDTIELGNDGISRQITTITANQLTFTPALAASPLDIVVENWGTAPTSLVADYHLGAGSACIDAGTPAGTDMGAYP